MESSEHKSANIYITINTMTCVMIKMCNNPVAQSVNPLIPKSAIWHIRPQLCQYLTDFYEFFTPRWSCEDLLIKRIKT